MTTLAIDIGGTRLAAALIGASGQIHDRREPPTPASRTPQALHDALSVLISPLQTHAQRIAIVSIGIVRNDSLSTLNPHNLGGLLHFPLVRTLEQLTNLPTVVISDVQTATWAEYQAPDGDITDMVFITVSTGAGDGVVSGGRLRTDPSGLAEYIGYTPASPHGPACSCGRTGCVGAIASGHGIATTAQGELAGANTKAIFTRVGQGDEQAQQLVHRSACTLARLIADIKATADCQCVVTGDSVGLAGEYLTLVETYLAQGPAAFHVDSLATHYHHNTGLLGAALLAQGKIL